MSFDVVSMMKSRRTQNRQGFVRRIKKDPAERNAYCRPYADVIFLTKKEICPPHSVAIIIIGTKTRERSDFFNYREKR